MIVIAEAKCVAVDENNVKVRSLILPREEKHPLKRQGVLARDIIIGEFGINLNKFLVKPKEGDQLILVFSDEDFHELLSWIIVPKKEVVILPKKRKKKIGGGERKEI